MKPEHSLADQITEVRREIALRANVYPKWVDAGRLKEEQAWHRISVMNDVLRTLLTVQRVVAVLEEDEAKRGEPPSPP